MTFAEVLPALAAGRQARWGIWTYRVTEGGNGMIESRSLSESEDAWQTVTPTRNFLLASNWELVDEPAPEVVNWERMYRNQYELTKKICDERDAHGREYRATIARLERELADAKTLYGVARSEQVRMLGQVAKIEAMERLLKQWRWEVK